jgi:NAD(P)-dependent dehydrogenase (short-subunit alcohol dehydrogenase family)
LFSVRNQSVVVTGAASGLGYAMSEVMAECGAVVTLSDIDEDALEQATERLKDRGLRTRSCVADVADAANVRRLIDTTVSEVGSLDVVFANAGISAGPGPIAPEGTIEKVKLDAWSKVVDTNLTSVFATIQAAVEYMKGQGGGRIVVTSSIAGLRGERMVGYAYAATKAGVANLVRQAALELGSYNIRINAIAPGPFRTNIGEGRLHDPEIESAFAREVPLGRIAEVEEIKGLALFLGSPASSYVTGAVVPIDGGALACPAG